MYFIGNDDYHKFLVFVPVLNSLILDNNKIFLTGYLPEYQLKKFNQWILILNRGCLIQSMEEQS